MSLLRVPRTPSRAFSVALVLLWSAASALAAVSEDERPPDYVHPLGLSFDHPEAWRVEETALGLSLVPSDLARGGVQPRELYLAHAVALPAGVEGLDDPRVQEHLTGLLRQTLPFLRPDGRPARFPGIEGARTFRWRGRAPTGGEVVALLHGRTHGGYFLSVSAVGEAGLVPRREQALGAVFRSLGWGPPRLETDLAGTWRTESYASAGSIASDRIHVSHHQTFVLRPDGTVRSTSETGVAGTTGGHDRPGAGVAGVVRGAPGLARWASTKTHLYVLWHEGGAVKYELWVQGPRGRREMLLTPVGGGAKLLWTEG